MVLKTGSTGHRYRCRGADPLTEAVSSTLHSPLPGRARRHGSRPHDSS